MKKVKTFSPRACRLNGIKLTPEFKIEHNTISSIQRDLSIWVYEKISKKEIEAIDDKYIKFKNKAWDDWAGVSFQGKDCKSWKENELSLRQLKCHPEVQDIFLKLTSHIEKKELNLSRLDDVLWKVVENYKGFQERNGKKTKRPIFLKTNKALNFKNGGIWIEDNKIKISTLQKRKFIYLTFKEDVYKNQDSIDYKTSSGKGGNISFNGLYKQDDNFLVIQLVEEQESSFFKKVIGIDINKNDSQWITFSEPIFNKKQRAIVKNEEFKELETQAKNFNQDLLKNKNKYNSKQRRKLHQRKKRAERRLELLIKEKIVKPAFLYYIKKYDSKVSFSIDDIGFGSQNSFGQEYIRDAFVSLCKKSNIAFVICPPNFSSQICPECGSFHKQDRKLINSYTCKSCGHFHKNCDELGAENIAKFGSVLMKEVCISSTSKSFQIPIPHKSKFWSLYVSDNDERKKPIKRKLDSIYNKVLKTQFNFPDSSSR